MPIKKSVPFLQSFDDTVRSLTFGARRVVANKAVVAVARELAGFVWAIGCEVQNSGWQGIPVNPPRNVVH